MRAAVTCLLVLLLTATNIADAREYRLRVYCGACRDIAEHPVDARNFGINQLYGARSWLNFDQADRFDIVDSFGNTATIDLNIHYIVLDLSMIWKNLPYALTFILQVRVIYPNGDIRTYRFDIRDLDARASLPVPASGTRVPDPDRPTNDGGSDEDDEDYRTGEADEAPEDDGSRDDSCRACEVYFDADEDGFLDEDPVEWIEEL